MGLNLCPYPSFEDGATGWTGWHDHVSSDLFPIASLTSPVETGVTTGARFEAHQTGAGQHGTLTSDFIPVIPGEDYIASFYYCGIPLGGVNLFVDDAASVEYWDAAQANLINSTSLGDYEPTTSWQRLVSGTLTPQVGVGIAYARVKWQVALQNGNCLEFTSVQFEKAPLSDYNDGSPNWTASLVIDAGAASTDDNDVTLTIACEDEYGNPPGEMRLAEDDASAEVGDIVWGDWEPYVTSRSWRLAAQTDDAAHARGVGAEFRYPETGEPEAPPEEEEYGCLKPETTSTLTDYRILGGTHDIEFDHVLFDGYVSGVGSYSTTGILISSSHPGDVHDIAFRNCVFATCGYGGGISNAFHAILTRDEMYNITFDHCWFEPASRICTEFNGRGGWWHDLDMTYCTFEGSCGEQFSCDMFPGSEATAPYGVTVGGVVRGVEGLSITDCLFEGTGATVGAYAPASWLMGLEFGCVYPYASDNAVGRSEFKRNKVGRCASSWLNFSYPAKGCHYMTFEDNVFDFSYNDHGADVHNDSPFSSGANLNYCTFDGNTYVLGAANNQPYYFVAGGSHAIGGHNTFVDEHWTKPSGSIGSHCEMPFTDSSYTGCHFHLPKSVTFPASATGSGNVFDNGYTGGDGSMT